MTRKRGGDLSRAIAAVRAKIERGELAQPGSRLQVLEAARRRERRAAGAPGQSVILRTGNSDTLRLADLLMKLGLSAWTPRQVVKVRRPRTKDKGDTFDRAFPMLPSFVFAPVADRDDLRRLEDVALPLLPTFHILRLPGIGEARLSASEMARLREIEQDAATDAQARRGRHYEEGAILPMKSHGLDGVEMKVVASDGRFTHIEGSGIFGKVRVETFTLIESGVGGAQS